MSKLEQAMEFLRMGISVIPLRHRSKEPYERSWEEYQQHTPTEYKLSQWLASGWNNYGVVMGWHGLVVIDFDDFDAFGLWKSYMELMKMAMPYTVLSSRGAHVYISLPAGGSNQKRRGVDVKFRGYVCGPGSVHPDGTMYMALDTQYRVLEVDNLDAILPAELFPFVAPAVCNQIEPMKITHTNTEYNYDPFAAAMGEGLDLISKIKRAVRIESFFTDIRKTSMDGRWYATLCPFHSDKNPSAWIDIKRQLFGCQVCGMKPMDCINLYARQHNILDSAAVVEMARELQVWA